MVASDTRSHNAWCCKARLYAQAGGPGPMHTGVANWGDLYFSPRYRFPLLIRFEGWEVATDVLTSPNRQGGGPILVRPT